MAMWRVVPCAPEHTGYAIGGWRAVRRKPPFVLEAGRIWERIVRAGKG
jgi:hypothetical protein